MIDQDKVELTRLIVIVVVVSCLTCWFGYCAGQHQTRKEAARNGVGAFVTKSAEDANTYWQWNTQTNK